jgi:hypothetical protein
MRQGITQEFDLRPLARALLTRGHTTASLGHAIGLSQAAVSRFTSGKTHSIGSSPALRLIVLAGGKVELIGTEGAPDVPTETQAKAA